MFAAPAFAANVIDFSSLIGEHGTSFFSLQENGFEVTVTGTNAINEWKEDWLDGNPLMSIASDTGPTVGLDNVVQLKVTQIGGGDFKFNSVDLSGTGSHTFLPILNGAELVGYGGTHMGNWTTYLGGATVMDELRISLVLDSKLNGVDNISVTAVPEPQTYAMMLGGLVMLGAIARRRKG